LSIRQGCRQVTRQELGQRRAGELFALLLISPGHALAFDEACEALCPNKEPDSARVLLHHATSALRRILEPDLPDKRFPSRYLDIEEGIIRLHLPPQSSLDFERFEAHCRTRQWQSAVKIYQGAFLPEYLYADWAVRTREAYSEMYQQALLALAQAHLEAQDWQIALEYARRLVALDAWNEAAVAVGIQALARLGDLSAARRMYFKLEKTLQEELGVAPGKYLQEVFRRLM
jgi:DNA-binding SARP family transcriptional activator